MAGVTGAAVLPGAEPFEFEGGSVGVLLVHGFTGSPGSMRPWGEYLSAVGLTVSCPLLPGHGTRWQDMVPTTWPDWYATAETAFLRLRTTCEQVFVMGLSMGGTLALRLAEQHGGDLAGLVTVNPSLTTDRWHAAFAPLLSRVIPAVPGVAGDVKAEGVPEVGYDRVPLRPFASLRQLWAVTRPELGRIVCPVLTYRSVVDHVVEASSGAILLAGLRAPAEERLLENSYHVATLDNDRETIFDGSLEFVRRHAPRALVPDAPCGDD
ncbi:esterase/lipase [Frankia casuarinae]|uniref:Esterase/lipase n=2 Tax=Frankia casuarinae (strain DSM 45818 / CECT 9043 / HFP020203 / CcI3) TaxID=106370 RepID=Q2J8E6_FRACC|nr:MULTISPECIES: alpha/beta fold hydrolase [Frankia]ABD12446.1 putative esterase/lipase [Frankia casuarinae]ETA01469.1 esterase/lipase [Frankia sp. CcI6]EYT91975.1 esterase/lipase [Frankia casuarinae]OFB45097.1 carboxylesterase [Frankia sp. CgIM4]OHV53114.1 carboxylesterase [Frankia sp. CgIS1]